MGRGIDLLRKKMKERGCTDSQCNSKAVECVISILANEDVSATDCLSDLKDNLRNAENRYNRMREEVLDEKTKYLKLNNDLVMERKKYEEERTALRKERESLLNLESKEAKERYRLAKIYKAECNEEMIKGWNGYTATVFVNNFGKILSGDFSQNDDEDDFCDLSEEK